MISEVAHSVLEIPMKYNLKFPFLHPENTIPVLQRGDRSQNTPMEAQFHGLVIVVGGLQCGQRAERGELLVNSRRAILRPLRLSSFAEGLLRNCRVRT